jgi:ATP-dependent DNA helicase PIF1
MTQNEALAILKTGLNVFLTGEPGSGKTHTINLYIQWLSERGVDAAVTASTGIAATHINGMTIHSWSGIGVKRDVSDYDIEMIQSREKTAKRIVSAKVLIIDEISMLDAATLDSVDRVLRTLRRRTLLPEEPFGGLQVIFVGDFFQLPPVSTGVSRGGPVLREKTTSFAFESLAWKEANPIICYLNEQHRQEDGDFLDLLGAFRRGALSPAHRTRLKSRAGILSKQTIATRLYTHNENVDRINAESLGKIEGKMHVFHMTSRGASALVESLKAQCLSPETLGLKEGASVMFTRNNFDAGYVNGTLGTVTGFSSLGAPIVKTRTGNMITAEAAEWAIQDGNKILAKITQVPLRLAWAITVHKSQGMSLDAAIIDLSQAFEFGQGYVAISRVRSLSGLFLEGFNERALQLHPKVADVDRHFRAYSDAARKKFAALPDIEKQKLEKNFLRAIGAKEVRPSEATNFALRNSPSKSASNSPRSEFAASGGRLTELREKHGNAYKKWTKEDDDELEKMFREMKDNKTIGSHFGRQASAIKSRLMHLGLIPNPWAARHRKKQ